MNLDELLEGCPNALIADALIITNNKVNSPLYNNIVCSISGGSDSDVMLDLCHRVDPDGKVKYVFFNTGLEYKATLEHLDFLQKKYNITIDRRKAIKPIPTSCKQYGVPFISKYISEMIYRLQRHNFKWEDKPYEELIKKYPKCKSALQWWCNCKTPTKDGKPGTLNISSCKYLKEFMITHPPTFKISQKCCTYAKKEVAKIYLREKKADLQMIGIRQAEGGIRSVRYKNCFTPSKDDTTDNYRPIFWFTDDVKQEYEIAYNVRNSRCYTEYGLCRTGCVGCPFNSNFEDELDRMQKYEPLLFKAVNNVFGKSYEYTRLYREFKHARIKEKKNR